MTNCFPRESAGGRGSRWQPCGPGACYRTCLRSGITFEVQVGVRFQRYCAGRVLSRVLACWCSERTRA